MFVSRLADDIRSMMDFEFQDSDFSTFTNEIQNFQQKAQKMSLAEMKAELASLEGQLKDAQNGIENIDFAGPLEFNLDNFGNALDDSKITISEWQGKILGPTGITILPFNEMMDEVSAKATDTAATLNIDVSQIQKQIDILQGFISTSTKLPKPDKPVLPLDPDEPDYLEHIQNVEQFNDAMNEFHDRLIQGMPNYENWIITQDESVTIYRDAASGLLSLANAMRTIGDESASSERKFGAFLQLVGTLMTISGRPSGTLVTAVGSIFGHEGGLVKQNGVQKFAHGGMVQGQDNVPIMAQAGEFIMKREAVQNIGVSQLAQMNRSGSAGHTIHIHGGIVQDDYIRNELIPALNKATSLGARINA